jgi:hypothetical protein
MPAAPESSRGGAAARDAPIYSYAPYRGALSECWRTLAPSRCLCMDLHTPLSLQHTVSDHTDTEPLSP